MSLTAEVTNLTLGVQLAVTVGI